jgi:hypothetical protein
MKSYSVDVTEDDIKQGVRYLRRSTRRTIHRSHRTVHKALSYHCPIAIALQRVFPTRPFAVRTSDVIFTDGGFGHLPASAIQFIEQFDRLFITRPFQFAFVMDIE